MPPLEDFWVAIDRAWPATPGAPVRIAIIGSTALMLQAAYHRGTKDCDVFETSGLGPGARDTLLGLAGPGTPLHRQHALYIDVVGNGVPFLPHQPRWKAVPALSGRMSRIDVVVLDVVDVVVSKLKRFGPSDQADIDAMIQDGRVVHADLVDRFRLAVDVFSHDARADDLPRYVANLHRVERDMLVVAESEIVLPAWI